LHKEQPKPCTGRLLLSLTLGLVLLSLFSTGSFGSALAPVSPGPPVDQPSYAQVGSLQGTTPEAGSSRDSPNKESAQQTRRLPIRLAVGAFDPLADPEPAPVSGGLRLSAYPGDGSGYYLVQFVGPTASTVRTLVAAGAEVLDYIPDFTFIVKMNGATRDVVERIAQIRWVGIYQPAYRLPADLLALTSGSVPIIDLSAPNARYEKPDAHALWTDVPVEIVVTVFRGEAPAPIITQIEDAGGVILDQSQTEWKSKLRVMILPTGLANVTRIPGVHWIERAVRWQLANNKATDIMGVRQVWDTHGLYGDGQTVGICDTGLDQGSTAPGSLHDDFENGNGVSRVWVIHDRVGDGADDVNEGHGTHVAGSVLGNGSLSGAIPGSLLYPHSAYAGVAPAAFMVFQAVEDNASTDLSGIPLDMNHLFTQAITSGVTLHTNSWGGVVAGTYTSESADVDEFVWNNPGFVILFAAGNEGIDNDADGIIDPFSVDTPGTAKNCITVGATENDRPSGSTPAPGYDFAWATGNWAVKYPSAPIKDDHVSNNPSGMAAFSGRGPTLDGRFKPDLVAPGTNVASTRSSATSDSGWGAIDAHYMYNGGTSMATPLAAGAATIVRQYYTDKEGFGPSAALVKATLVNGATNIAPGQYGVGATREISDTRPTNVAGWGRVNLRDSLFPTATKVLYHDVTPGLSTGYTHTYTYTITSSAHPFRATLAWSDYPGSPSAAGGLVNDLDLRIVGPGGVTTYPNNASQRGNSQHLSYDDGIDDEYLRDASGRTVAVRFEPVSYPVTIDKGSFLLGSASSSFPKTFTWIVYDDDGTGGQPNTVLVSGTTTIRSGELPPVYPVWHVVDLSRYSISIDSGEFYLAIEVPDDDLLWGCDRDAPDDRSWTDDGSGWTVDTTRDYMFNAVVKGDDDPTQQDRVNNLVGIDIEDPTTGVYTISVSAYHVPCGPQPYALVASGAMTGSSTAPANLHPPTISSLPDQTWRGKNVIDLWAYADDDEDYVSDLRFSIANTPIVSAGVGIDRGRYVDISATIGWTGTTEVVIQVQDTGGLTATDSLVVTITATPVFLPLILRTAGGRVL
jgi:hypothetical protein